MFPSMTMVTAYEGVSMVAPQLYGGLPAIGNLTEALTIGVYAVQLPEIQTSEVLGSAKAWWAEHGNTLTPETARDYARTLLTTPGYGDVIVFLADAKEDRCAVIMAEGNDPSRLKVLTSKGTDLATTYLVGDVNMMSPAVFQFLEYIARARASVDLVDSIGAQHWLMTRTGRANETLNFVVARVAGEQQAGQSAAQSAEQAPERTHRDFNIYVSRNYAILTPWMDQVSLDQVTHDAPADVPAAVSVLAAAADSAADPVADRI
jgi:hypothetical protein